MGAKITFKRGTTAQCDAVTPSAGEPIWDTTLSELRMGDGSTAGGISIGGSNQRDIKTVSDSQPVRINSRAYTQTSGDTIGYQSKPSQEATTTGEVYGNQISPRVQDTFGARSLIGGHFEPILKGTSGTITDDVRAIQAQITDENSAGRTISGDIVGIRFWQQLAAHTVTGKIVPIKVDAGGGNKSWQGLFKLAAACGFIDAHAAGAAATKQILFYIGSTQYALDVRVVGT